MKLKGKVALIAGGGQGIGEGIALCLAEEGAEVAIVDINPENAKKVAGKTEAMGRKSLAISADLTDDNVAQKTVRDTVDFFSRIDILVNNVGGVNAETMMQVVEHRTTLEDETLPEFMFFNSKVWDQYYKLNLKTHVLLSQAVTPHFIKQRSGKIINISSVSGRLSEPGHMPYGSMKAADISLTWSLARALAPYNINVNCICPGHVYTPLWEMGAAARHAMMQEAKAKGQEFPEDVAKDIDTLSPRELWLKYTVLPGTPLGREQTAEDMGRAVVFLVSEDAKNITGQALHVDGGLAMR